MDELTASIPDLAEELTQMTALQRLYFEGRARGLRPIDAARAAGSLDPKKYATDMEKHPRLRLLLKEMGMFVARKSIITRDDVLHGLKDAINAAETAGEQIAGWREIGKILGIYAPQVVEHTTGKRAKDLKTMSDEALMELANEQAFALTEEDKVVSVRLDDVIDADFTELPTEDGIAPSHEEVVQGREEDG